MRHGGRAILLAGALAGCGGESTTESAARTGEISLRNASVGEVAEQTEAAGGLGAAAFSPGEWETRVQVTDAQIAGMPPAMVDQMRKQLITVRTSSSCMTPDEATRPNETMFSGTDRGNCRFDRYDMANGRIAAAMTCMAMADQPAMTATMQGRYDATSFDIDNRLEVTNVAGAESLTMAARVTGKRLGDCTT
ncbi:DUF3617 domain-containing protein [Sphingomonas baiyangensis]|uniref:DUF3617 domain-containing protein n=1 Tax=Sphingomonas baiyangensis TaxID=2572576 RepID=A0A4U1L7D1_9SPHN|nr:DUF3617 domain-containing protein [Sphingomonas baiyangensis]TKD52821.1 DUF3617 domain-containing protein [Sphingomonas baiyangensis]